MTLALLGLVFPWICLHMVAGVAPWGLFFTARRASLCQGLRSVFESFWASYGMGLVYGKNIVRLPRPGSGGLATYPWRCTRGSLQGPLNVALGRPLSAELRGIPPRVLLRPQTNPSRYTKTPGIPPWVYTGFPVNHSRYAKPLSKPPWVYHSPKQTSPGIPQPPSKPLRVYKPIGAFSPTALSQPPYSTVTLNPTTTVTKH